MQEAARASTVPPVRMQSMKRDAASTVARRFMVAAPASKVRPGDIPCLRLNDNEYHLNIGNEQPERL